MKRTWMAAGLAVLLCLPRAMAEETDSQATGSGSYFAAWTGEEEETNLTAPPNADRVDFHGAHLRMR